MNRDSNRDNHHQHDETQPNSSIVATHDETLFYAKMDSSPKTLMNLLQTLQGPTDRPQPMTIYATSRGLSIHSSTSSSLEIPQSLFSVYKVSSDHLEFCISWRSLLNALGVLCLEASSLCWTYTEQHCLRLEGESPLGAIATATLPGMMLQASPVRSFGETPVVARWLSSSRILRDLVELDHVPGATAVTVRWREEALECQVQGHSSKCTVWIPGNVQLERPVVEYSYPYRGWKLALQALDLAQETCLSVNGDGLLALQHQLVLHSEDAAFCDAILVPLVQEDNETAQSEASLTLQTQQDATSTQCSVSSPQTLEQDTHHDDEDTTTPRQPLTFGSSRHSRESDERQRQRDYEERRQARRKKRRSSQSMASMHDDDDSVDLLQSHSEPQASNREEDERYCSSPELVYGEQD